MDDTTLRFATIKDHDAIISFVKTHWKSDHIFVKSKTIFDWQHLDRDNGRINFVLGVRDSDNEILGILGFITQAQFDPNLDKREVCWMALWKVRDSAAGKKIGRRLWLFLEEKIQPKIIATIGASAMTIPMYEKHGYKCGVMDHFFIADPYKKQTNLIEFKNSRVQKTYVDKILACKTDCQKEIDPVSREEFLMAVPNCQLTQKDICAPKSATYFDNRYFNHPAYQYQPFAIKKQSQILALMITRISGHHDSNTIRIIDFVGSEYALIGLSEAWIKLVRDTGAEYVDFVCAGFNEKCLALSGFAKTPHDDTVIVPNYFEPFERKQINIRFMMNRESFDGFRMVKGDSDQDRPNFINTTY